MVLIYSMHTYSINNICMHKLQVYSLYYSIAIVYSFYMYDIYIHVSYIYIHKLQLGANLLVDLALTAVYHLWNIFTPISGNRRTVPLLVQHSCRLGLQFIGYLLTFQINLSLFFNLKFQYFLTPDN